MYKKTLILRRINTTMTTKFLEWLNAEIHKKGLAQADIARKGIVTDGAVSLLFSGKTKKLTFEMCKAIALTLDEPLAMIYRKAGLLPPIPEEDQWIEKINYKLQNIPKELREIALKTIDAFVTNNNDK